MKRDDTFHSESVKRLQADENLRHQAVKKDEMKKR